MSSPPISTPPRSTAPIRAVAQLSAATLAVLCLTPWGSPSQAPHPTGMSLRVPYATGMVHPLVFELDDAVPLPVIAPPTGTPLQQPVLTGIHAANASVQDALISTRIGGRLGG